MITAALNPDLALLREAAESLVSACSEPVAWRVQLDDAHADDVERVESHLARWLAETPVTLHVDGLEGRAGAGAARMRALALTSTPWATVLDADDLLPPAALTVQLSLLDAHPDARWALGAGHTLDAEGSTSFWPHSLPELVPAGLLAEMTRDRGFMPTMPIAGVWSTDAVLAVGGWPATPVDEDTSLKLALTSVSPGVATPASVYVYRRGVPGQVTGQPRSARQRRAAREQVLARLRGLAGSGLAPASILDGDWSAFLSGQSE